MNPLATLCVDAAASWNIKISPDLWSICLRLNAFDLGLWEQLVGTMETHVKPFTF